MHNILIFIVFLFFIACRENRENNIQNDTTQSPLDQTGVSNQNEVSSSIDRSSDKIVLKNIIGCAYNKSSINNSLEVKDPGLRAVDQIKSILKYSGLPSNFQIYSADIDNAIATLINNERYIIFDNKLLNYTDKASNNYWASMSILAHEIGHHLSGHTLGFKVSNHNAELQADKFSGFVLYKLGATIEQAQYAMKLLASNVDSESHPALNKRLDAIKLGWSEANETRYESAIPPPPDDITDFTGGYSEFKTEYLLDEESYNSLRSKNGYGSWVSDKWEGIILEDINNDKSAFIIYVTKVGHLDKVDETHYVEGEKYWISLDPYRGRNYIGNAGLSWLHSIMVPGRRIEFSFISEGSADNKTFAYIKYLPAISKQ